MATTQAQLVEKVKSIMNELGESESLSLISEDTLKIEEYITKAIPDAVAWVQSNTKKPVNPVKSTPTLAGTGTFFTLELPSDYVRLLALRMSNWKMTIAETYPYRSEEHKCQENEYTRSLINHPKAIEGFSQQGKKALEFYAPSGSTIQTFVYDAKFNSATGIPFDLTDPMTLAVCYMTASLVYDYFENHAQAEKLKAIATEYGMGD